MTTAPKLMRARMASTCSSCNQAIEPGDTIGNPQVRNREGGNVFVWVWYCQACALDWQEVGPSRAPFLTIADQDADRARRAPILARLEARGWARKGRKGQA